MKVLVTLVFFQMHTCILLSIDGVYAMDNIRATVENCATNIPACKPMRAIGAVEALFTIESIVTNIAVKCGLSLLQVRVQLFPYTKLIYSTIIAISSKVDGIV